MEPRTRIFRASALFLVGAIAGLFAFTGAERRPLAELLFVGAFAAGLVMLALCALSHGARRQDTPRRRG